MRFKYSMNHTNIVYSDCTSHVKSSHKYTLYTRVKVINPSYSEFGQIGEIDEYCDGRYIVRMSSNDVAGFSQDFKLSQRVCYDDDIEPLDGGLNSPFICDIDRLTHDLKHILSTE